MAKKKNTIGASKRKQPFPFKKILSVLTKGVVVACVSVALVFAVQLGSKIEWDVLPVNNYSVEQILIYQDRESVDKVLRQYQGKSLLFVDLADIKDELEALPWVLSASVQKQWPGTISVSMFEHEPVAVWNSDRVLNSEGIPLMQPQENMQLAQLFGPEQTARRVMSQYLQFAQVFADLGMPVSTVTLHARGAWRLELAGGIEIVLGDQNVLERSRRVVSVLKSNEFNERSIQYIDARYPNGVALKYESEERSEAENDIST